MRPHTRSRTTRNFFVYVMVSIDQRLGRFSLEEIVRSVHHQLRAELEPRGLRRHISRNVAAERHPLIRIIPIVFKDAILRTVHRLQGEAVNTASFSNLGTLRLPVSVSERIRLLEFVPPASYTTGINVTAVSTAETASIGFGSVLADHRIERRVARQLAGLGLRGRLVCNWRHEQEYAHVL